MREVDREDGEFSREVKERPRERWTLDYDPNFGVACGSPSDKRRITAAIPPPIRTRVSGFRGHVGQFFLNLYVARDLIRINPHRRCIRVHQSDSRFSLDFRCAPARAFTANH